MCTETTSVQLTSLYGPGSANLKAGQMCTCSIGDIVNEFGPLTIRIIELLIQGDVQLTIQSKSSGTPWSFLGNADNEQMTFENATQLQITLSSEDSGVVDRLVLIIDSMCHNH